MAERPTRSYVVHKTQWERLKNQANPPQEIKVHKNAYIEGLIEESRNWMKTWPDTSEGLVLEIIKQRKEQRKKDLALVAEYKKNQTARHTDKALKKARKIIFDRSSHGNQLWGALLESKVLEERDAQIKRQKQIDQDFKEREKALEAKCMGPESFFNFSIHDEEEDSRKMRNRETWEYNKEMMKTIQDQKLKDINEDKLTAIEEDVQMKRLLELEKCLEKKLRFAEKQDSIICLEDKKKYKEHREKAEARDDALTEMHRKSQDKIRCREKQVHEKIIKRNPIAGSNYTTTEKLMAENEQRYDFIDKRVVELEKQENLKEEEERKRSLNAKQSQVAMVEFNKKLAAIEKLRKAKSICWCDRPSLFIKPRKVTKRKQGGIIQDEGITNPSLAPRSLQCELRKRQAAPSPYTGSAATHATFASEANTVLADSVYKGPARKVIDEYRRINCLDSKTLPVLNY